MASFLNKWLLVAVFPVYFFNGQTFRPKKALVNYCLNKEFYHPIHVSVVEINHNAEEKTLEISCKIFTDDFEKVLAQNYPKESGYKSHVDLINPPDKAAMDTLVKRYVSSHLSISIDGRPVNFSYLGFERDNEAVFSYLEVDKMAVVRKMEITNKLMHDMFTDQTNLMHIIVGGDRKSTKLDYPKTSAEFSF